MSDPQELGGASLALIETDGSSASNALGPTLSLDAPDAERRFGGLRRLYGDASYQTLRASSFAVVGLGGVGSWAAEALARCGVARLVLIDLDHVAESNINRQVQAVGATVGMAKGQALARRIADIHPDCDVVVVDEFVGPDNWPALLTVPIDGLIDACDQSRAKLALARWALAERMPLVVCGAAGGKRQPQGVRVSDLSEVTHDPLLASLRQRLRQGGARRKGRMGVEAVHALEPVARPQDAACATDGSLNCHGYGSTVTVTATFGLVAAQRLIDLVLALATEAR